MAENVWVDNITKDNANTKVSIALVIREKQIKTKMRHQYTSTQMATISTHWKKLSLLS